MVGVAALGVPAGAEAGAVFAGAAERVVLAGAFPEFTTPTGFFEVRITLSRQRTPMVVASVQVAFSIKSLVRCTPNCTEDAPPKAEDRPPPLGFCAITTMMRSMLAIMIRIMKSVKTVVIYSCLLSGKCTYSLAFTQKQSTRPAGALQLKNFGQGFIGNPPPWLCSVPHSAH